ncbi:MAG: hypothetical protein AB1894_18265 [Chloroflexota bacterium]
MTDQTFPSLEEFLQGPIENVRQVAPTTFIYAASGTRRAAALAGVPTQGDEYPHWSRGELFRCVALLFDHGVRHLCMPMLGPSQFSEVTGDYQQYLWDWFERGIAGPEALETYQRLGWRVRIAFSQFIPRLREAGERLRQATSQPGEHTLWCFAVPEYHLPLQWMLEAALQAQARTPEEAVQALYGEVIPSAGVYLSTGKPLLSTLQIPPLLMRGILQGYWNQRPGYSLDEPQLRMLLYDYGYLRRTWQQDKRGRAEQALAYRKTWEQAPILGVGMRLGPFWYPAPIAAPE